MALVTLDDKPRTQRLRNRTTAITGFADYSTAIACYHASLTTSKRLERALLVKRDDDSEQVLVWHAPNGTDKDVRMNVEQGLERLEKLIQLPDDRQSLLEVDVQASELLFEYMLIIATEGFQRSEFDALVKISSFSREAVPVPRVAHGGRGGLDVAAAVNASPATLDEQEPAETQPPLTAIQLAPASFPSSLAQDGRNQVTSLVPRTLVDINTLESEIQAHPERSTLASEPKLLVEMVCQTHSSGCGTTRWR